ncbi:HAMP domain-containing histidine kinase [Muricauda oceani]|uniref:histidine kinase n=1 Tax=Flagellimonas oceani TaxID=2698672 RepID=A0A6G7J032_9FLAO|nr:HAMP domain-containing sensor histidine kinase [Allomuricauda oceani]MBW8245125.1 HAMP domain-containing histidine kinase [Allomuricauda oceani]QII44211.1 HAMP domain-containing histidine kinase [Allomuricauda oceani]
MLTKRNLYVIVFIIAVVGLLVVQYQYLRVGLGLAKAQFSEKMDRARDNINSELSEVNSLTYTLGNAIRKDTSEVKIGLDSLQKASQYYLNDYISYQLNVSGIDAPFSYTLYSRDSITYLSSVRPHLKAQEHLTYPIKVKGYLPELLQKEIVLEIGFEDLNKYFLGQLRGLILPGLLFLLMIIVVVIWVLRSFYLQRSINTTTNDFINNLTHELKTPVFSIGLASKILEEDVPDNKKAVVELIRTESNRLKKHIDKVLELASMESGKNMLQFQEMDFKPELERICESFQLLAEHEGIHFEPQLENGPYFIKAEKFHLENVVGNLLENAKKYSDNPKVRLKAYKQKGRLFIEISDNGQGIAKEDIGKIFRKYYRVKNGDVHKVKGYGLGLYYVQKIIKLHRGKIQVQSELGQGTTFTLSFKLTKNG